MSRSDRWSLRPLLDEKRWSLLPVVHLSVRSAIVLQVVWAAFALAFVFLRPESRPSQLACWLLGAWALFYITQRLGGRQAVLGGAAPKIRSDSPFQIRLLGDFVYLGVLVAMACAIAFGPNAVRALLSW